MRRLGRQCVPAMLPAQRVQIARLQFFAAVADDLRARDVEYIDAPARFGGEQIGSDAQQLIRIAVGALRNGSALPYIPIAVGTSMHRQYRFRLLAHDAGYSTFASQHNVGETPISMSV